MSGEKKTYEVTVWFESFAWATREIEAESPEAAAKIADDDPEPWFNDSEDGQPDTEPQFIRVTDRDAVEECEFDRDPVRLELEKVRAALNALLDWHDQQGGWGAPCWAQAFAAAGRKSQFGED